MLTLTDVTWRYQNLLMHFSFDIKAGERVAILGPSGAGKSTLLSLIAGFIAPLSGTILLNGVCHTHTPPAIRPVSMLFQENNLFNHLSVYQNIALGFHPGMKLSKTQRSQLMSIAEKMGLTDMLERLPSQLSGGQRQRVALARCLVRQQPILLLDEPFSALDPALRLQMLQLLDELCEQQQFTLLMVSHSLEDAAHIASRSLVVVEGNVVWDGDTTLLINGGPNAPTLPGIHH